MEHLGWTVDDILTREAFEVQNSMNKAATEVLSEMGLKETFFYRPCIDGYVLPDKNTSAGLFNDDIDIMVGSVYGDGSLFGSTLTDKFENQYDVTRSIAYAPQIIYARRANKKDCKPLYTYFIERKRPGSNKPMPHGAELPYFFGTLDRFEDTWTDFDRKFSEMVMDYWTNFAKSGNPNGEGLPDWAPYTPETPVSMNVTDSEITVRNLVDSEDSAYILDCLINKKEIVGRR
jgi:hypothetical protein